MLGSEGAMRRMTDLVEVLLDIQHDKRQHPRTKVDMTVEVLVAKRGDDSSDPAYLSAVVHDVSSTGAMLSTAEKLSTERVWLRFVDLPEPMYLEADVVRTAEPQIPMAHSYGVRFARMLDEYDFTDWVRSRERRANRTTPLEVTAGDEIDLGSNPCFQLIRR